MTARPDRSRETDPRLRLLIGLVAFVAGIEVILAAGEAITHPVDNPLALGGLVLLIGLGGYVIVRLTRHIGISWTDSTLLVGVAVVPIHWVILCTLVGVGVTKLAQRRSPIKVAFAVGKEIIVAGITGVTLIVAGIAPEVIEPQPNPTEHIASLAIAFCIAAVFDDLISTLVISLDSRKQFLELIRANPGQRLGSLAIRFGVAVFALYIIKTDARLIIAVPPLVLALHLVQLNRARARAERIAWQQLAAATDALNDVRLESVLETAIRQCAMLFGAERVELDVRLDGDRRTIAGDSIGIFEGAEPTAVLAIPPGHAVAVRLEGQRGGLDVGQLRMHYPTAMVLSERERFLLRTFAAALATAIRNASAYMELARLAERNAYDAAHDPLTGLANRRRLSELGAETLRGRGSSSTIALLVLDIHHFKEINDALGHPIGDRVLIEIARRLTDKAGDDTLVARLGGDEFAVLFTALRAPALAAHRARSLLAAVAEPLDINGTPLTITPHGGIAVAPSDGDIGELQRRADIAMYEAKKAGERLVAYAKALDTADLTRLEMGGELPRAVAAREFALDYQPIVDLGSGVTIGAEALARWHHPDRGYLDPRRFLETVERSGQLNAFTEAILDQALTAAGQWIAAGTPCPVAVNVSPRSLLDKRFPALVADVLDSHRLPAGTLIIELTESITLSHLDVVDQVLEELHNLDVKLALDDFGTGFSSLSALSRVPVAELKIDRSFVAAMDSASESAVVVRSTVELGRSLGLLVVAEGVERIDQRQTLWSLGCAAGQGHLFARPMSGEKFAGALLRGPFAEPLHGSGAVVPIARSRRTFTRGPR
ncbi:diguanylate cyclase (GGDEF)-like protein [Allocatelliglobosispora scoriae]|uniref:Diguanylate cyclase (GGDEF)-like protein n=1 Tax=Allocatelliglobosispora scoriae TaxID=643052 RepID=A0A841BW30_9ACTN|nr:EAL domain-containing protein [Allocatelliglobosispora scoriae]MBB5870972.1 diguanylate cyclase (GGDEF)-like protein [Allocatelliglobosispora scoriae]